MWINIIGENFKELLSLLKSKPIVIIVLALMFVSGLFINKWTDSTDNCTEIIRQKNDTLYMYKYEAKYYQELYKRSIDSINNSIRETFKKPLENQNQNQEK